MDEILFTVLSSSVYGNRFLKENSTKGKLIECLWGKIKKVFAKYLKFSFTVKPQRKMCLFQTGLLFFGPHSTHDKPRWYIIISAHSVYSSSIITLNMSFKSFFFSNYMSFPLFWIGFLLQCILTYSILNFRSVIIFHFGFFSFNHSPYDLAYGILSGTKKYGRDRSPKMAQKRSFLLSLLLYSDPK